MLTPFFIGVLATMFLTAGLFFLRFWKETGEILFLAFSAYFAVEGLTQVPLVFTRHPGQGAPWIYWTQFLASFVILGAILRKNLGRR